MVAARTACTESSDGERERERAADDGGAEPLRVLRAGHLGDLLAGNRSGEQRLIPMCREEHRHKVALGAFDRAFAEFRVLHDVADAEFAGRTGVSNSSTVPPLASCARQLSHAPQLGRS